MKGVQLYEDRPDELKDIGPERAAELGIEDFSFIPPGEFPEGVTFGYTFRTWSVNPMVYCSFLLRRFSMLGGKIRKQHIRRPEEIFAMHGLPDVNFVVNASGIGFGDPDMFIIRGNLQ